MRYRSSTEIYQYLVTLPEFSRALAQCYPDAPEMHTFFEKTLYRADRNAKILAGVSEGALFATAAKWLGRLFRWNRVTEKAAKGVTASLIVGGVAVEIYQSLHLKREMDQCVEEGRGETREDCVKQTISLFIEENEGVAPSEEEQHAVADSLRALILDEIALLNEEIARAQSEEEREVLLNLRAEQEAILNSLE